MSERHSHVMVSEFAAGGARMFERAFGSVPAQARTARDSAEAQRIYRAGRRSAGGSGSALLIWEQPRNGLPWKPYIYRGRGYDIYEEAADA